MTLPGLTRALGGIPGVAEAVERALRGVDGIHVTAIPEVRPALVGAIAADAPEGRRVLVVTATAREAEDIADAVEDQLGAGSAVVFASWETLPHERLSPRSDTVGRRLEVLRRIAGNDPLGAGVVRRHLVRAGLRFALLLGAPGQD